MTELKMLNLSTCHIPFNEVEAAKKWAMYQNDYGWIFWADMPVGEFSDTAPVLAFIIRYAAKREFNYVQLDADGDVNDNLPTFTWPAKADADKEEVKS